MLEDWSRPWWEASAEVGAFSPSVNVYEKDANIVLEAELPGVKKEDIDVRIDNGILTLKGERKEEEEVKKENYFRRERFSGSFLRSFPLPSGADADTVEATFKDGLLTVKVPRSKEAKRNRVEVR
jgi:HSP20 family protein